MKTTRDYTISSVKKSLDILKLFDEQHTSLTLSEISEMSGMGKSSTLRFLYTLLQDFVSRDKNGNLRAANILKLRKKVDENPRLEPIREYVQMIEDAWQPVKSKTYIRLEERTETGAWKAVPLNATEV